MEELTGSEQFILWLIFAILQGLIARYINGKKGRSKFEGFWFGFIFGIIAIIILALKPKAK